MSFRCSISTVSIATHVAEGYTRATPGEQRDSYLAAKRALARLESELAVAKHAELLPAGAFADLASRSGQVAKLLTGYLVYLDRQIDDGAAATLGSARAPS